ncbi:hypothetical protein [Photobacterium damselae]|uniref:hypothetical protein n=1 Tax=Photobacterium damselae TaxID=38293 RepID=UPI0040693D0C
MLNKWGAQPNNIERDNIHFCQISGESRRARKIIDIDYSNEEVTTFCGDNETGFIDIVQLRRVRFFTPLQQDNYIHRLSEISAIANDLGNVAVGKTIHTVSIVCDVETTTDVSIHRVTSLTGAEIDDLYLLTEISGVNLLPGRKVFLDYRLGKMPSSTPFNVRLEKLLEMPTKLHLAELVYGIGIGEKFEFLNVFASEDWTSGKVTDLTNDRYVNLAFKVYNNRNELLSVDYNLRDYDRFSLQNGYYPSLRESTSGTQIKPSLV